VLRADASPTIRGTVYFLHGGNGNDEQWIESDLTAYLGEDVETAFRTRGIQIVLPSIGMSFLRDPVDESAPSYWRHFLDEVIPDVERGTHTTAETRWVTGISMGGHAALSAMLRRPEDFAGCGVHFPGLIDFNPFDDKALSEYTSRTGIPPEIAAVLAGCFRGAFRDIEELERHDPVTLLHQLDGRRLAGKTFYVDVGTADVFGLRAGCDLLANQLVANGATIEYELVPDGTHEMSFVQSRISRLCSRLLSIDRGS
jgi:S-formylglutathione hydrolase FrmB